MFDVNYNLKDIFFCVDFRIFEIFDSLFGINVDLGVMEGIDNFINMEIEDFGVGLEFNLEILNDMEFVLILLILIWF